MIERYSNIIKAGGTVVFPTETVYGLGANALDPTAVAKIYEIKQRPLHHPLIVHVPNVGAARDLVADFPPIGEKLAEAFWPGPLTLVMKKNQTIPDIVTGGLDSIGIRVPSHPVAQALLSATQVPIAAPSANPFGCVSATSVEDARQDLGDRVDGFLDGGDCPVGLESTIVSLLGEHPTLLRPGGIPIEDLEKVIGRVRLSPENAPAVAPGMLAKHYSPKTRVVMVSETQLIEPNGKLGLLCLRVPDDAQLFAKVCALSPAGDLREAAAALYQALRLLDSSKLDLIVARRFPEIGLGNAINDRLERASR